MHCNAKQSLRKHRASPKRSDFGDRIVVEIACVCGFRLKTAAFSMENITKQRPFQSQFAVLTTIGTSVSSACQIAFHPPSAWKSSRRASIFGATTSRRASISCSSCSAAADGGERTKNGCASADSRRVSPSLETELWWGERELAVPTPLPPPPPLALAIVCLGESTSISAWTASSSAKIHQI